MPTKTCAMCGSEFFTRSHTDYCDECRPIRIKQYKAEYYAKNPDKAKRRSSLYRVQYPEKVKATNRAYYMKNRELILAKAALKYRKKVSTLETTEVEVDGQKITLYTCDRLKIKAAHLPCGDKWECWDKKKCRHVPEGKEPKTFEECVIAPRGRFNPAF